MNVTPHELLTVACAGAAVGIACGWICGYRHRDLIELGRRYGRILAWRRRYPGRCNWRGVWR